MSLRLLLGLLAVALLALTWFVLDSSDRTAVVASAAEPETDVAAPSVVIDPTERVPGRDVVEVEEEEASVEAVLRPLEVGEERLVSDATGDERTLARIHFDLPEGSSVDLEGTDVAAQSWLRETDEVLIHEATMGPDGYVEFEFPGAVHVDWFRCTPEVETGLAITVGEPHVDLAEGELFEARYALGPAAIAFGRIETADGTPLEGVDVFAYFENDGTKQDGAVLAEWYPAHVQTQSRSDGSFELSQLAQGEWYVAIPPVEWVQVQPLLLEEDTWIELESGDQKDLGVFRVVPAERLVLTAKDPAGRAVESAYVTLRPLQFASAALAVSEGDEDEPSALRSWLDGSVQVRDATVRWEEEELELRTNKRGRVECVVVAGMWEASVRSRLQDNRDGVQVAFEVPGPPLVVTLPNELSDASGKIVDENGKPIRGASVEVTRGKYRTRTSSDERGRFELRGLLVDDSSRVRADHRDFLPGSWPLAEAEDDQPPRYVLRRSEPIRAKLVSTSGPLPKRLMIGIVPDTEPVVESGRRAEMKSWLERARIAGKRWGVRSSGNIVLTDLFPGTYEVGLYAVNMRKFRRVSGPAELVAPLARWTLSTGEDVHELEVDLSGYTPPAGPPVLNQRGVVRDAVTREAIPRALVVAKTGSYSSATRTGSSGSYQLQFVPQDTVSVFVAREGYLPYYGDPEQAEPGDKALDVFLQPGGQRVSLQFLGERGGTLPEMEVRLVHPERPDFRALFFDEEGDRLWQDSGNTQDGRIVIDGLVAGPLECVLTVDGFLIGQPSFDVVPSPGVLELDVYLEDSVEEIRERLRDWLQAEGQD